MTDAELLKLAESVSISWKYRSYDEDFIEFARKVEKNYLKEIKMDIPTLAAKIAKDIFACGDEPRIGTVQRLQFMGGQYPDAERPMGGLSEYHLRHLIERTLSESGIFK